MTWVLVATIIGPQLPAKPLRLSEGVGIAVIPPEEVALADRDLYASPSPLLMSDRSFAFHTAPRTYVKSGHVLSISVNEPDEESARRVAEERADEVVSALTLAVGDLRYHYQIRYFGLAEDSGGAWGVWSKWDRFMFYNPPEILPERTTDEFRAILSTINSSDVAKKSFGHLLIAWKLGTIPDDAVERATLQHYFLAIEVIADSLTKEYRKSQEEKIKEEQHGFADEFASRLAESANKVNDVRDACKELNRIAFNHKAEVLRKAGESLGLQSETIAAAIEFYNYRSRALSHPGAGDQKPKFEKADALARVFLREYCRYSIALT